MGFLLKEKLFVGIGHSQSAGSFRGRLKRILYSNSVRPDMTEPVLLGPAIPTWSRVAGVLWVGQPPSDSGQNNLRKSSESCSFSYTVQLSGLTAGKPKDLQLSLCNAETKKCRHKFRNDHASESQRFLSQELDFLTVRSFTRHFSFSTRRLFTLRLFTTRRFIYLAKFMYLTTVFPKINAGSKINAPIERL